VNVKRQISDGGLMSQNMLQEMTNVCCIRTSDYGDGIVSIKLSAENSDYCPIKGKKKVKSIPVTGREGPYGCENLDNRLTDGGKVVSLMRRSPFTPQEDSWYSFLLKTESTPGPQCGWKN
jgi:hypothetical protein